MCARLAPCGALSFPSLGGNLVFQAKERNRVPRSSWILTPGRRSFIRRSATFSVSVAENIVSRRSAMLVPDKTANHFGIRVRPLLDETFGIIFGRRRGEASTGCSMASLRRD